MSGTCMHRAARRHEGHLAFPWNSLARAVAANARWRLASKGLHRKVRSASSMVRSHCPAQSLTTAPTANACALLGLCASAWSIICSAVS